MSSKTIPPWMVKAYVGCDDSFIEYHIKQIVKNYEKKKEDLAYWERKKLSLEYSKSEYRNRERGKRGRSRFSGTLSEQYKRNLRYVRTKITKCKRAIKRLEEKYPSELAFHEALKVK